MARHHSDSHIRSDIEIVGKVSSSQDAVVVNRGGYRHATLLDTATARKCSWCAKPHNTDNDGCCYTLNTRYEFAAISDYTHGKHCKTCVMHNCEN